MVSETSQPLLKDFSELVDRTSANGIPAFSDLQTPPFMKYWKNLVIFEHTPVKKDFRIVLFGSEIAENYGGDWTGLYVSETSFNRGYKKIYKVNQKVMSGGGKRFYDTGKLSLQEREYRTWHQIKMPLLRNNAINEVLVCMSFE